MPICGDQTHVLRRGLGEQEVVERVIMSIDQRQRRNSGHVFGCQCENGETVVRRLAPRVSRRNIQLARAMLDRDFPKGGSADPWLIGRIGQEGANALSQPRIIALPPDQDMGIEQQFHLCAS